MIIDSNKEFSLNNYSPLEIEEKWQTKWNILEKGTKKKK